MFSPQERLEPATLDAFKPRPGSGTQAATVLQSLGFRVRHVGTFSISCEGPRELWEKTFRTKVERAKQAISDAYPELGEVEYFTHVAGVPFEIPSQLKGLVERAYPQRPPTFFESPLPPRVGYNHLEVPSDVAMILRATQVQKQGITGEGVLVAMPDTGFYRHAFYTWHGYHYNATLSPDAILVEEDFIGHGTAEAANIFATAPDIDFIGIKMC